MSYTITSNGTIKFDWEDKTPEEIREELAKREAGSKEVPMAA